MGQPLAQIDYPAWVLNIVRPQQVMANDDETMSRAIEVALANISRNEGGGPFAAMVVAEGGEVISIGYNRVVAEHDSTAHAEVQAIRRAEVMLGSYCLRGNELPRLRLFSTTAPCLMCTGAIHWAGVPEVVTACRAADATAIGFDEGTHDFDVAKFFEQRKVVYRQDFLRQKALTIFDHYRIRNGVIYNG